MAQVRCLECDELQDSVEVVHGESDDDDDAFVIECECGCNKGYEA